ncbi:glycosyltransferase [Thermomonas sp.]|uniref:glycosyltransferase n=1 Tax=Thermomonas sp. TaxID=1971895 RepID=UPI001AC91978|nr:glycosyltransferase [Xanthomonadales bacterium]MBN8794108.1 glycosyltransferase [Stenotrophomonas nitritireducens]
MKLLHVVPHISAEASGPSYSVPRLCQALAEEGHAVRLSCLGAGRPVPGVQLDVHPQWPVARRFAISPAHARALAHAADEVDIVHNHSLWSMVNVAAGWVVPGKRARLVVSPRGTLSSWALGHSRWRKRLLWPLQRRVLAQADLLHATSEEEYREIRALGFNAPVAIVPNGIDVPELLRPEPVRGTRTLLFLSRLHPKKGIDRLLDAWAALEGEFPEWQLVIAGKGEPAHEAEVKAQAARLGLQRVRFPGPLYGQDKAAAYRAADLFVLPTHSENFGMVVAEALAHGCPAIVSKGAPWSGLEQEGCGWWIEHDVPTLQASLARAMALPVEALRAMGLRGREWMLREYGWASVARRLSACYRWMLEGGDVPAWVMQE